MNTTKTERQNDHHDFPVGLPSKGAAMNRTVTQNKTDWRKRLGMVSRYIACLKNGGKLAEKINWQRRMLAVSRYFSEVEICLEEARGIIAAQRERLAGAEFPTKESRKV